MNFRQLVGFEAHLATLKVKFDDICLAETWLTVADENINMCPGYEAIILYKGEDVEVVFQHL